MRVVFVFVAFGLAAVTAAPKNIQRIVGGELTTIENYPYMAAMLFSWNEQTYQQACGGSMLNARAILSAAHCFVNSTLPFTTEILKMRVAFVLVAFGLTAVTAAPKSVQRIVGGEVTTIERHPYMAALMYSWNLLTYHQSCGGSVLNARAILSAAHCFVGDTPPRWRVRVGSTMANSGGVVHHFREIFNHPDYVRATLGADISILHTETLIVFNELVQPIVVPGRSYELAHNDSVIAIGWGTTSPGGVPSEQLREVEVWYVSNAVCRARYGGDGGYYITNDMLCSGWLDVGGRDQCQMDSGGPLIHRGNVVVGVCSWGISCALAYYPGVNARVSSFTEWIQRTA